MHKIALAFILILTVPAFAVVDSLRPSPLMNQLKIGYSQYGAQMWQTDSLRDLYANRYNWLLVDTDSPPTGGDGIAADIDSMRTINENMVVLLYTWFAIRAQTDVGGTHKIDINDVYTLCSDSGYSIDSILYWLDDSLYYSTDASHWFQEGPGDSMVYTINAQNRVGFDPRNTNTGLMFFDFYKPWLDAFNCNGLMIDEEGTMTRTGDLNFTWFNKVQFPFRDSSRWDTTGNYGEWNNGLTRDWTGMTFIEICDSVGLCRAYWQKTLADSLAAYGYVLAPNWSSIGSPVDTTNDLINWFLETRHATVNSIYGAFIGEFCAYDPSRPARWVDGANGSEKDINMLVDQMGAVKDSAVDIYIEQISVAAYDANWDTAAADVIDYPRTRMNALGLMLECLWPGTSKYRFNPHSNYPNFPGQDMAFNTSHSVNVGFSMGDSSGGSTSVTVNDYLASWSGAWCKYFGYPADTGNRDTTNTGTDSMGQDYTVHRIALTKPYSYDTLTYAVGRYCRGVSAGVLYRTIDSTAIRVDVPVNGWYELDDDGNWTLFSSDSVDLGNANWRIFSSDTLMSDTAYIVAGPLDSAPEGGESKSRSIFLQ